MDQNPDSPHRAVAERMFELRKGRGWSAQKLAEEMTRAGVPWERMVVTKLENGRRAGVTVQELFALARVLDVSPVHLLVPTEDDNADYLVTPTTPASRARVRAWIRGLQELPGQDPREFFRQVPLSEHHATITAVGALIASGNEEPPITVSIEGDADGER